jgi:hypothetical protein
MEAATMTAETETSIFDRPVEVPEEWRALARKKDWPEELIEEAVRLRLPHEQVNWWLTHDRAQLDWVRQVLAGHERVMFGTLRVREANWDDDDKMVDLYANSPEQIGDWEVTVERGPNPYAQFRLQEHVNMQVVEDRGIFLAAGAHSGRNTIIGGMRVSTHIASAWRVRKECRGQGLSNLLRMFGGPACAWFGVVNYWYMRSGNTGAFSWIKALRTDLAEQFDQQGDQPGVPVSVQHFSARPFEGDASAIRTATPADAKRCVALINRTHRGLDFFRPYTEEFLHSHLDDPFWGPKPAFWAKVFTWDDAFVVEEDGKIVACGGLWDRGANVRERWRHSSTGEERVIESTALMDFGYAKGREDAMAKLIAYFIGRTSDLGRAGLMVPLDQYPALAAALASFESAPETRRFCVDQPFPEDGIDLKVEVKRPYTDLAYW